MPVTSVKSSWSSGSLVFHEKTSYAPSTTYDLLTVGTSAVKVGNTANDVDFQYYGTGSISAIIDCGAKTFTLTGIALASNGALTITNATATSSTTTGALIVTGGIATAADITCGDDLFMSSGGVINFNGGDVTLTHSSNALTVAGGSLLSTYVPTTYTAPALGIGIYGTAIVDTALTDNILASVNFSTATNKTSSDTSCMAMYIGCSNTAATTNNKIQGLLVSTTVAANCFDAYGVQGHLALSDNAGHSTSTNGSGAHLTAGSFKATIASGLTVAQGTVSAGAFIVAGAGSVTQDCACIWMYANDGNVTAMNEWFKIDINTAVVPYFMNYSAVGSDDAAAVFADTSNMTANATSYAIKVKIAGNDGYIPVFDSKTWNAS